MPLLIDNAVNPWQPEDKQADWARKALGLLANAVSPSNSSMSIVATASNNAGVLKASSGRLLGISAFNVAAYPVYIKFYDKASAPVPATDNPVAVFGVPANSQDLNITFPDGRLFTVGIAYAIVKLITRNDNTALVAGDCVASFNWN